jgi:hypothetical protein
MSASSPSNPLVASQLLSSAGQSVVQPPTLTLDGAGAIARAGQATREHLLGAGPLRHRNLRGWATVRSGIPDNTRQDTSENCAVLHLSSYSKRLHFLIEGEEEACGTGMIRGTTIAIVATPGTVTLVDAAARAIAIGIATRVMYSRRISTPLVEASAGRFGSATVCTRSMAARAALWQRSARLDHRRERSARHPGRLTGLAAKLQAPLRRKG